MRNLLAFLSLSLSATAQAQNYEPDWESAEEELLRCGI